MAINDPVPSTAFDVLQRNVQDVDRYLNTSTVFNNRVGLPIKPIPMQAAEWQTAIGSVGWFPVGGDFSTGATLTARNQVIYDPASTAWYSWGGALPKTVPASSSPASTGGISAGAWTMRSDATAATALTQYQSAMAAGTALINGVPGSSLAKTTDVAAIDGLKNAGTFTGVRTLRSFYVGGTTGGGFLFYDALRPASAHNGVTVIAKAAVDAWDGTASALSALLSWSGSGTGCYIRVYPQEQRPTQWDAGAPPSGDQSVAVSWLINNIKTVAITGFCRIFNTVAITSAGVTVDAKNAYFLNQQNKLFTASGAALDWDGGTFDGENKDFPTFFTIERLTVAPRVRNQLYKNVQSSTFVRAFEFSDDGVDNFQFQDIYGQNLYAAPDGIVGNANGSTRLVYMNPVLISQFVRASSGYIDRVFGVDILTAEDADLVHVISNTSARFNIKITNCAGINVGKRIVKVQARGVKVSGVYAFAENNAEAMWSPCSIYRDDCVADTVIGVGAIRCGADSEGVNCQISNVNCDIFGVTDSFNLGDLSTAIKIAGGSCNVRGVQFKGTKHAVQIFPQVSAIGKVEIDGLIGECYNLGVNIRNLSTGNRIESVNVKNADFTAGDGFRALWAISEGGGVGSVRINGTFKNSNYFHVIQFEGLDAAAIIDDATLIGSGTLTEAAIARSCVGLEVDGLTAPAPVGIRAFDCDNTLIRNVKKATTNGVYLVRGNNHVVNGVFCAGNPTTPVRLGATTDAPTNVKIGNVVNIGAPNP